MNKIEIQLLQSSQPIVYEKTINAYTKGNLYCILFINSKKERVTHKFPLMNIFRIIEEYPNSER